MSSLDNLDDLIASLETPTQAGADQDSFEALLDSLADGGGLATKRASRPLSRRQYGSGLGAPVASPSGRTESFESLLASLTQDSPQESNPPAAGGPSTNARRAVASPSPPVSNAKDPDDMLDQLLASLNVDEPPAPAAAPPTSPVQSTAPVRRPTAIPPQTQTTNLPRPASRQIPKAAPAPSSLDGVDESLNSLLAALETTPSDLATVPSAASKQPQRRSQMQPAAPARGYPSSSDADYDNLLAQLSTEPSAAAALLPPPPKQPNQQQPPRRSQIQPTAGRSAPATPDADFDNLLAQLNEAAGESPQPAPSKARPNASTATLRPSFAATERLSLPQPMRATIENLDQHIEEKPNSSYQNGLLQPQFATAESVGPIPKLPYQQPAGYGSQQYGKQQSPSNITIGHSDVPSPYSSAGSPHNSGSLPSPPTSSGYPQQQPYQAPYQPTPQQPPYQQQPSYQQPFYQQPYRPPSQQSYQPSSRPYQPPSPLSYQQYNTVGPRTSTPIVRASPYDEFNPSVFEEEFKREINLMRRDPQAYGRLMETERRPYYQDKIFAPPGAQRLMTREGIAACDEAIHFLMSCQPAPGVEFDPGLCQAAKQAVNEGGPTGTTNISSLNNLHAHGTLTGEISELSKYGALSAREMVMTWLISDGDPARLHRMTAVDPKWTKMGVAAAKHNSIYKTVGLATFCTGYESNEAATNQLGISFNWN